MHATSMHSIRAARLRPRVCVCPVAPARVCRLVVARDAEGGSVGVTAAAEGSQGGAARKNAGLD